MLSIRSLELKDKGIWELINLTDFMLLEYTYEIGEFELIELGSRDAFAL
tara:strand:+ start:1515 stop:1661 length:147 start_codon:yes stop_codon:yes gene_type:complete